MVAVGPLAGDANLSPVKITHRSYFAQFFLWAAKDSVEKAKAIEEKAGMPESGGPSQRAINEQRSYVISAIVNAASYVEATINEVIKDSFENLDGYKPPFDEVTKAKVRTGVNAAKKGEGEDERLSDRSLEKYQSILSCCNKDRFNTGSQDYQNAYLLSRLRNHLIHYEPGTYAREDQPRIADQLNRKFPPNPLIPDSVSSYFPDQCLGSHCAVWAISAAECFVGEFLKRVDMTPPAFYPE